MLIPLMLSLMLPAQPSTVPAALAARGPDPAIRLKISDETPRPGQYVSAKVKTSADGYLVVVRMDGEGHVRMVFPVDPGDGTAIRGGHEMEIRGRGGRRAFRVDEAKGVGTVLAAVADQPFRFDAFVKRAHWDFAALDAVADSGDAEAALVNFVEQLTPGHFAYDLVQYDVSGADLATRRNWHPYGYWGGWYGSPFYDPFDYGWGPFFGRPWVGGGLVIYGGRGFDRDFDRGFGRGFGRGFVRGRRWR